MYQPYPQGGGIPPEPGRSAPPRPVRTAVTLMYVGAALDVISAIVVLFSISAIERAIRTAAARTAHPLTAHQVHAAAIFAVVVVLLESLIAIGLWLLMAWANRNGKAWGRITATVLFGLNTILFLLGFARPSASLSVLFAALVWLVGLGAIVLLWRRESSEFFAASRVSR